MSLEEHKKVVRQHIDLSWNRGRLGLAEQLHSSDFLYKSSFTGVALDSAGFAHLVEEVRLAMPDIQVVLEECIAEGNKVFTWCTMIGTIERSAFGYPASDRVLSISAMAFWTLNHSDEIQEICTMFDMESFRAQMGLETRPFADKALP